MKEWISVEDRLPDEYEDVLAYDGKLGVYRIASIYYVGFMGSAIWTDGDEDDITISHWMSLPAPPGGGCYLCADREDIK